MEKLLCAMDRDCGYAHSTAGRGRDEAKLQGARVGKGGNTSPLEAARPGPEDNSAFPALLQTKLSRVERKQET